MSESVIIAGAGPAGCAAALYLAQNDIPVTLLEGQATLPLDLRASTFHPPTLDMLASVGVTEKLIPQGLIAPTYQYRDRRSGEAAIFDLGILKGETDHPFRLQVEQFKMTQLICDMLKDYPHADVRFSRSVIGFRQNDKGVRVLAFGDGDEEVFEGSYLIGADGANSRVRQSMAVLYDGFTYPEKFLVVSTTVDFAEKWPNLCYVNYVSDPEEWCVLLRTPSVWRVLVPTGPELSDETVLSDEFIQDRLQHLEPLDGDYPVIHRTLYKVHQRVAETYRVGRTVLVGDSCHINNPLGGMGMNGGLHDAFNAAEKLTSIIRDGASDDLLDRYDRQRRQLAVQFVQEHTIRNKELIEAHDEQAQAKMMAKYKKIADDPVAAKELLMTTSMIKVLRETAEVQ
jgi:3-(3-hydroxy-phenyl)propionate hydroxylase